MEKSNRYVYGLFRSSDLKPIYIGKGSGSRYKNHRGLLLRKKHESKTLQKTIDKLWALGDDFVALKIVCGLTEQKAHEKEKELIKMIGLENLANKVCNTMSIVWTDSMRSEFGKKCKGKFHSQETREKISNLLKRQWASGVYNNRKKSPLIGETKPSAKLTEKQAREIKYEDNGSSAFKIAEKYDISVDQVNNIKSGRQWKHI